MVIFIGMEVQDAEFDFDVFFDLSPYVLCIAGLDGYFRRVNPTLQKLLGYTESELKEKPIIHFLHSDDRETTEITRKNLKSGTPLNNFENRYLSKKGEIIWLSWTSKFILEKQLVYGMATHINPRKEMEAKRNELIKELSKTNEKLKQLTMTTSHDLRSPVNNILAVLDILENMKINDKDVLELIDLLHQSTLGLKKRLDDFLTSLKKDDLLHVKTKALSFNKILNESTEAIKSLIKKSNSKIISDFTEVPSVKFNKYYLESIFLNLISNAIKYTRPDTNPLINIRSYLKNGVTILSVKDHGMGFDMEKVEERIFGFNQKFHDHEESQGIGLYLVYNHVTSLGGKIEVKSEPDKGTEFLISFKTFE